MIKALEWKDDMLIIIDQTKLPLQISYIECKDYKRVTLAITRLEVRGAPAIGAAAAFALALAAKEFSVLPYTQFIDKLTKAKKEIASARPTAVNLFWALERVWCNAVQKNADVIKISETLTKEAVDIFEEDIKVNRQIGRHGAKILSENCNILTHCNAGAMATCGWGTALGVIREAHNLGKIKMVYADETRPLLQGARITAWELMQDDIPLTLLTDSMAGWVMKNKMVDIVITGADRIALNGDTANKIGTYTLAVLAQKHDIPFYIAAPSSTIDFSIKTGEQIPIEERVANEVTHLAQVQTAPSGVKVFNPAFDITANELISAIITEHGVLYPPYDGAIHNLQSKKFLR